MYGVLEKIHRSLQTIFVTIKMCEYQRICGCEASYSLGCMFTVSMYYIYIYI